MQPKMCECGCGTPAPIAKQTSRRFGHVKGEPCRFVQGHTLKTPASVRFSRYVDVVDVGCWEWKGGKMKNGYGRFGIAKGQIVFAHRYSYEAKHGPIPPGLFVLHSCDNPGCVNPSHLSVGTHADNMQDMRAKGRQRPWNALKTHCPSGHEYNTENTYIDKKRKRQCKACKNAQSAMYRARKKVA
jgi:hypothetical protein